MQKSKLALFFVLILVVPLARAAEVPIPAPPEINARGYLVVEHFSGKVLAEKNADERLEPASITKLMTAYVAFNELKEGNIALTDEVPVSEKAWRTPGSRMFIEVGKKVDVESLLLGVIVQSGNDASVALAEHLAGSEETFAAVMNQYAKQLGMNGTHYINSTGLPVDDHYTTAADIARLARALIREFPEYYTWYSQREFEFNNINQYNRNLLLLRDPSVDGLKTGHTDSAGYCLAASAERSGMRLVSVVLGTSSDESRIKSSQALLNYGFRFYETHKLYAAGAEIKRARVWKGAAEEAGLGPKNDVYVTIPRGRYQDLKAVMNLKEQLVAPLQTSEPLGQLKVSLGEQLVVETPLYSLNAVAEGGIWRRAVDGVLLWFE